MIQETSKKKEALFAEGKIEEAEAVLLRAVRENSRNKVAHNNLGMIAVQKKDLNRARGHFLTALKIDPLYEEAIDNLSALQKNVQHQAHGKRDCVCSSCPETRLMIDGKGNAEALQSSLHPLDPNILVVPDRKKYLVDYCKGKNVLHIGCVGSGSVVERIKDKSHLHYRVGQVANSLVGIDNNAQGIHQLIKSGFTPCYIMDIENQIIDPEIIENVDLILVPEVLEHLSNPGRFLDNLKRLNFCNDIIISVPNAFSYRVLTLIEKNHTELVHPDHNYYFSCSTIRTLLRKHGFIITDQVFYYWPTDDSIGKDIKEVLGNNPHFAEGMICIAGNSKYVNGSLVEEQSKLMTDKKPSVKRNAGTESEQKPFWWKLCYSSGIAHHGENARKMLGLDHYIPSLHHQEPVWFFGMYFESDYLNAMAHQGRKIINWRGSDALQLANNAERIKIIQSVKAIHVCQGFRQQDILADLGVRSIVRPMFNTSVGNVPMTAFPMHNTEILVFWKRGIDDFIRADLFFQVAAFCPDVVFHIVGDEEASRFKQPGMRNLKFHGFISENDIDRLMDQCKGTIRPWVSDGNPNIQTKMLLKGRYAAHSCKFEKVTQCTTLDEYADWINNLKSISEPNIEARKWWLQHLNNFDFLEMDFNPGH